MNKYLTEYIEQKNRWRRLFNQEEIDPANISPKQARELWDSLDADMSPENLTCDGELKGAALKRKFIMLHECMHAIASGEY